MGRKYDELKTAHDALIKNNAQLSGIVIEQENENAELRKHVDALTGWGDSNDRDDIEILMTKVARSRVVLRLAEALAKKNDVPEDYLKLLSGAAHNCKIFLKVIKGEI